LKIIENTAPGEHTKTQLFELWNREYPEVLQFENFSQYNTYLSGLEKPTHFMIKTEENSIIGWFFCFERDHDNWFGLLVHHQFQNQGLGKTLIKKAQTKYSKLNAWIVKDNIYKMYNGKTYKSPLNFYLKYGFRVVPNKYRKTDKISTIKIQWKRSQ